jgi:hypothetical protein
MKKTVVALAIGLVLLNSHSSASAKEKDILSNKMANPDTSPDAMADVRSVEGIADNELVSGDEKESLGEMDITYPPFPSEGEEEDDSSDDVDLSEKDVIYPPFSDEDLDDDDYVLDRVEKSLSKLSNGLLKSLSIKDLVDVDALLKEVDVSNLSTDVLDDLNVEQLAASVLGEIDPEQFKDLSTDLIKQLRPEHFDSFTSDQFEKIDDKEIARMIANVDSEYVNTDDFDGLLPEGWAIGQDGSVTVPAGENIVLPFVVDNQKDLLAGVTFPEDIPDLMKGVGIGGEGEPLLSGLKEALVEAGFSQFDIKQDKNGIMQVTGIEAFEGVNLAFMPDVDNMKQGVESVASGLTRDKQGLSVLTTPKGQVLPIRPAPKSLGEVKNLIAGGKGRVKLGKRGDVSLMIPEHEGESEKYRVGVFDALVATILEGLKPGIHFPDNLAGGEPATVVYNDGTLQKMFPTVPFPDVFIEKAKEFDGVDDIQFKAGGTFELVYKGKALSLKPTFVTKIDDAQQSVAKIEPSIVLKAGQFLEYRYQQDDTVGIFRVNIE